MSQGWTAGTEGVLVLPGGRAVRGRGIRAGVPEGALPEFGVYLSGRRPPDVPWESRWVRWPDFGLPSVPADARRDIVELWERAATERVEVACGGGVGRTGTALACLLVLDGVPPDVAVEQVRRDYRRRAVETPWQRRYVRRFAAG